MLLSHFPNLVAQMLQKMNKEARTVIIQCIQAESYKEEIENIKKGKEFPSGSPLAKLDPFIDSEGLLRV